MSKIQIFKISIFLFLTFLPTKETVFATDQFKTEYNINYNVDINGETTITQTVVITNNQDYIVPINYGVSIRQLDIYDIEGKGSKGNLDLKVTREDNQTLIKAHINQQLINGDQSTTFEISYKSKQIATVAGEIWNIYIPQVFGLDKTEKYNVTLNVPVSFGPKIYISPTPNEQKRTEQTYTYLFDKYTVNGKGVTASFGKYQNLNFSLKYELKNNSFFWAKQQIALPAEIKGTQQLFIKSIAPKPYDIKIDEDGNLLAEFILNPKQKLSVQVNGEARISGRQINPDLGGSFSEIPYALLKNLTKADKYWESDSIEVKKLSESLIDKNKNVTQNAWFIYNYIVKNLEYNFEAINNTYVKRRGALYTLRKTDTWTCMEFTDLFIAIARTMGIPARELNGYAFATDYKTTPISINFKSGDLLHSWPEFYDPNFGWIQIDPTWGSTSGLDYFTKLDTNHFVFAIKGLDSEYPLPAGTYRFNDEKQVDVQIAQNSQDSDFKGKIFIKKQLSINIFKIFKKEQKYLISNVGGTFIYNINGTSLNLIPFEKKSIYVSNNISNIFYETPDSTIITVPF